LAAGGRSLTASRLDAAGELPRHNVWTGTDGSGRLVPDNDCAQWSLSAGNNKGGYGSPYELDTWSAEGEIACSNNLVFYCVSKTMVCRLVVVVHDSCI
jgi:hypothetical protein